jgi:mannose-6-phosphate isomerase-like protein (cupin superfamily)
MTRSPEREVNGLQKLDTSQAVTWRVTWPGLHPPPPPPPHQHELYVVLEGTGRVRVDDEQLTLAPLSALLVEPESLRQIFNDTGAAALWLVMGAPPEGANTLQDFTPEQIALLYPDGLRALPPELS